MTTDLISALTNLNENEVMTIIKDRLENEGDPLEILNDSRSAMEIIGENFESGKIFIPELMFSGEILKKITDLIKPKIKKTSENKDLGKIIMGTVAGDIHDLGKDIVCFMLEISGFKVYDLGVDVPANDFVEKIKEVEANVVGLSGLLTVTYESMEKTIDAIRSAFPGDKVKIMIGGGAMDGKMAELVKADAYGADPTAAVKLAKNWIGDN